MQTHSYNCDKNVTTIVAGALQSLLEWDQRACFDQLTAARESDPDATSALACKLVMAGSSPGPVLCVRTTAERLPSEAKQGVHNRSEAKPKHAGTLRGQDGAVLRMCVLQQAYEGAVTC